ncbi:hypothetical protein [Acidovorax sp. sic0104]|uniref:hypothetical protein n=1 Tax=Acidovorax sp. sic0104 TaxID=2854784 RepID=UPI001C4752E1|nr:hypothetical protein [Acidovorax sp. sic0104]MBV7541017.1 hypothetical protein [Acidovorax sp. sic0104]
MPQDFLRQLAHESLPQTFRDVASVDKIRVLVAAELVEASLPAPGEEGEAVVKKITPLGRATATTPRRPAN